MKFQLFLILLLATVICATNSNSNSFKPGALWLDTDGKRIKAHSAGLLEHKGTYYWYGADNYTSDDGVNKIINVYQSKDLYNWENKVKKKEKKNLS